VIKALNTNNIYRLVISLYSTGNELFKTALFRAANTSFGITFVTNIIRSIKVKVKQSRYTPWRRLGGEEV
jgi:hypothetical protein